MTKLNNFAMVASKVLEIIMWVALGLVVLGLIASCIGVGFLNKAIRENKIDVSAIVEQASEIAAKEDEDAAELINVENYNLLKRVLKIENILREDGTVKPAFLVLAMIDGILNCLTFAMVFRNIHLILKTAKGSTWFAKGKTPFQSDITRMIREIGIFLLALAALELTLSFFSAVTFNPVFVVIGILMLCLSSFFRYGEQLQNDADGLI